MAALFDVNHLTVVDDGPDVAVLLGSLGKAQQHIKTSQQDGIQLYLRYELLYVAHQIGKKLCLQRQNLVFSPKNLLFIFLQLLGDVALSLCQCLLAHPFSRHLVLIGVAHLQIVAEHVVVAYLQRLDARLLGLALLNLQQVVLARIGNVAQIVEFGTHTVVDHPTLLHLLWRIGLYLTQDALANRLAEREPFAQFARLLEVSLFS